MNVGISLCSQLSQLPVARPKKVDRSHGHRGPGSLFTAVLCASFLACADGPVSQPGGMPSQDEVVEMALEPVFAVGGGMAEEEHELFGSISSSGGVAFDGAGNLYIFDDDNFRVLVFDSSGGLVRQFGTEGEGPDEWRRAWSMSVFRDGTVWIGDHGHRVYHVYDPNGQRVAGLSMSSDGSLSLGGSVPDPRGGAIYTGPDMSGRRLVMRGSGAVEVEEDPTRPIERWSVSGEELVKEPFYSAWKAPKEEESPQTLNAGGMRIAIGLSTPKRFEPALRVAPLPSGGVAVVDSSAYLVTLVGPDGQVFDTVERPSLQPRVVTEAIERQDKERRIAELEESESPGGTFMISAVAGGEVFSPDADAIKEMQRNQIEETSFFGEIPVIADLAAGWGGTLWIERTPEDWWEEDGPIDLVSSAGDYLGTVDAGGPRIPHAFGPDGLVAHVELDELDVATIVVRRLPEGVR